MDPVWLVVRFVRWNVKVLKDSPKQNILLQFYQFFDTITFHISILKFYLFLYRPLHRVHVVSQREKEIEDFQKNFLTIFKDFWKIFVFESIQLLKNCDRRTNSLRPENHSPPHRLFSLRIWDLSFITLSGLVVYN